MFTRIYLGIKGMDFVDVDGVEDPADQVELAWRNGSPLKLVNRHGRKVITVHPSVVLGYEVI